MKSSATTDTKLEKDAADDKERLPSEHFNKKTYSQEFLLQFQNYYTDRPKNHSLPEKILTPIGEKEADKPPFRYRSLTI